MKKYLSLLLVSFTLTSYSNYIHDSNVYSLEINEVRSVLSQDSHEYDVYSTRSDRMARFTFYYEILEMNHYLVASVWKNSYSINYRIRTQLDTEVSFANGMFNWFTETANTKIKRNTVEVTIKDVPSSFSIINKNPISDYNTSFRLCEPDNNGNAVVVKHTGGSTNAFYTAQNTYNTNEYVTEYDLNPEATIFNTEISENNHGFVQDDFVTKSTFRYPNNIMNGQIFNTYGTISFLGDAPPSEVRFTINSESVIDEGSVFGECRKIKTVTYPIYL